MFAGAIFGCSREPFVSVPGSDFWLSPVASFGFPGSNFWVFLGVIFGCLRAQIVVVPVTDVCFPISKLWVFP